MLSQQDLAEEARIQALHALGLLDTPREDRFDRFTRLAAASFRVPIAVVSLIDRERQWFKSRVGLAYCETPRSIAFCSHAIALDDMLVVPDTLQDERFQDHPHVTGAPGIRFYAGQPLHSLDGQPLGTLCIIDTVPRAFGDADRQLLCDLARLVDDELNRDALVTARLRAAAEQAMRQKQALLDAVLETVDVGVVACDADGRLTLFNRAARDFHGLDADSGLTMSDWPARYDLYGEDGLTPLAPEQVPLARALRGERVRDAGITIHVPGSAPRRLLASGRALQGAGGEPLGAVVAMHDVTELAASRARLAESGEWLRTIADNVPALIAYVDTGLRYRFANERYREWFGVRSQDMIGRTVLESMGEAFYAPRREALERCLSGHASHLEIEEVRRGRTRVISSTYLPHVRDGVVQGIYVLSTDATSAREYERQLHALAHSDHLTGLPNRRSYEERLAQAVARARRGAAPLALAYLDIDHFKQINDGLGHAVGDAVLREFAQRLSATVRSSDTVARLAGDEFVVVLEQVGSPLECERIAAKLHDAIRLPFALDGRALQVTSSIGIAWSPHPDPSALAHVADEALYRSKHEGRDRASVFVVGA
ncbi:sensor domain-containing diguanylate cyclase [Massilia putida]|uniref:sensor domain-containing diguanylate cyclase n=1 Tax=Massilia putida TaxID=1141883 RepID=UPI000952309E|nr:diguanylate cyclase [Massilia putida]